MRPCGPTYARKNLQPFLSLILMTHAPNFRSPGQLVFGLCNTAHASNLPRQFAPKHPPKSTKPTKRVYTSIVTSQKGVIGFGSPTHSLRRKPQSLPQSTCGLFVRASKFWRLGQGAARLAGSRKRVSGLPTCSSCRPHLEVGAVVLANHTRLEASHG